MAHFFAPEGAGIAAKLLINVKAFVSQFLVGNLTSRNTYILTGKFFGNGIFPD